MNFGDLFFLFVFVAIILLNIYKKMPKPQKASEEKKPGTKPGWKQVLDEVMKQLKEEVVGEAAPGAEEAPVFRKTGWEDLVQQEPEEPAQEMRVEEPVREPEPVETAGMTVQADIVAGKPNAGKGRYPEKMGQVEPPVPGLMRKKAVPEALSVQDLRSAVVWSEILALPLGLRNLQ